MERELVTGETAGDRQQRGQPVDLDAAYREHVPALLRLAFLLCDSSAAAEDAVHDVFLRCAPRLDELDHPASYLRRALINECGAQRRNATRTAGGPSPESTTDLPHEALETRRALGALNERQRTAVVLRYFVDVPEAEIAEALDCQPATVRSLLHRAKQILKEELT